MSKKHIKLPATEYKISAADFVTVNDVIAEYNDGPLQELQESFESFAAAVFEAEKNALKEDIKANTVIIDKHFAKVNAFDFVFGRDVMHLPPMICGLEIQVSDELPDGYDFAVLEVPETEREHLIKEAKAEVAREIFEEIEFDIHQLMFDNDEHRAIAIEGVIADLKKKYTEDEE